MLRKYVSICFLVLCAPFLTQKSAFAQYPERPIQMIVPFAAGGGADVVARIVAAALSAELGQQVVVDNRGGAGGTIGSELAADAEPDGYTLVMQTVSSAVLNAILYPNLTFDLVEDFEPIGRIGSSATFMYIHNSVPAETLDEFLELARANPGRFSYNSSGLGAIMHLTGELLSERTGIEMVHVPYRGAGDALTDFIAGATDLTFGIAPAYLPYVNDGILRALMVNGVERHPLLPDVPTAAESGLEDFEISNWYAIFGPAGTPSEVIERVNQALVSALEDPEVVARLEGAGIEPSGSTPEELAAFQLEQLEFWEPIITRAGIQLE